MVFLAKLPPDTPSRGNLVFQRSLYWNRRRVLARLHALSVAQADVYPSLLEHTRAPTPSQRRHCDNISARTSHTTRDRAAWGTTTFSVLALFTNPLAEVFPHAGGSTAHQQNLKWVEFHAYPFPHTALTLFSTHADCFLLPASCFLLLASCFLLLASCFSLIVFRFSFFVFRFSLLGLCSSLSSLASCSLVRAWC
jgi:hypothetical protein